MNDWIVVEWWRRFATVRKLRRIADHLHKAEGLLLAFPTHDPYIRAELLTDPDADADAITLFNARLVASAHICHRAANIADGLAGRKVDGDDEH